MNGSFFAGIDLGSTMTKVIITDNTPRILAQVIKHTGAEHRRLANQVMQEALKQAEISFADFPPQSRSHCRLFAG